MASKPSMRLRSAKICLVSVIPISHRSGPCSQIFFTSFASRCLLGTDTCASDKAAVCPTGCSLLNCSHNQIHPSHEIADRLDYLDGESFTCYSEDPLFNRWLSSRGPDGPRACAKWDTSRNCLGNCAATTCHSYRIATD